MAARRRVTQGFIPGLEPGTPAARVMYLDTGRRRRPRQDSRSWKKPARRPCDFTAAPGLRCELESVKAWEVTPGGVLTPYAPGWRPFNLDTMTDRGFRYFDRCALHPVKG